MDAVSKLAIDSADQPQVHFIEYLTRKDLQLFTPMSMFEARNIDNWMAAVRHFLEELILASDLGEAQQIQSISAQYTLISGVL